MAEEETDTQIHEVHPHRLRRVHARLHGNPITGAITKLVVSVIGLLVIIAGLVMLVAPGPGVVAIILGLAILATEWAFAERWMNSLKDYAQRAAAKARDMDPAVRRRRIIWTFLGVVVVGGALAAYLAIYDWPGWATGGWDQVQDRVSFVPDLPGM